MDTNTPPAAPEQDIADLQAEMILLRETLAALENEMIEALEQKRIEQLTMALKQ